MLSASSTFVAVTVGLTTLLATRAKGMRLLSCSTSAAFPASAFISIGYFLLASLAFSESCEALRTSGTFSSSPSPDKLPEENNIIYVIFSSCFLALFIQGLMQVGLTRSPARYTLMPCLGVHAVTLIYYGDAHNGHSCVLYSLRGHEVHPMHYILWICSMSSQVLTFFGLEQNLSRATDIPVRDCCLAILSVVSMCWTGLLSDAYQGAMWVRLVLLAISVISFYTVLYFAVFLPASRCKRYMGSIKSGGAGNGGVGHDWLHESPLSSPRANSRLNMILIYIMVVWHIFPVAWLLGFVGAINSEQLQLAYGVLDTLAKFLPVSLYISVVAHM